MAAICRQKSGNFRVQIRVKGLKLISRTLKTEVEALAYQALITSELDIIQNIQQNKLPIDTAVLFSTLHPDLKKHVQLLPVFARVLGDIAGGELTLTQLIDKFLFEYDKKDQNMLHRLMWWTKHYGHLMVSEMTEDYVRHGLNKLLVEGVTGKRGVLPQTTNRFKANLSSVFEFGKNKFYLKNNPCTNIKSKPEGKGRKRYLTIEEQQRLLSAARQIKWDEFYLLVLIALTTGARRSELCKLKWRDIDWDKS